MATELARMQQRRDTALAWTANNPVLSAGEIGFESDTGKFKIGDGSTVWASLAYQGATGTAGVSSFNTRTGAVTLSKADVTGTGLAASDVGADASGAAAAVKGLPLALAGAVAATRYVGGTTSGAPASGTFAVGDFVIDQTGKAWICTTAGSPGTWTQLSGGGGGSGTTQGAVGTGLGATQTVNFAGTKQQIDLVGLLNVADLTVTYTNRVANCVSIVMVQQDATGGRTLHISDGVTPQPVTIASAPNAWTMVEVRCPDASNIQVAVLANTTGYLLASSNLSDLLSIATARTNLGLSAAATALIDATASDFQMDGTAAAGSTGKLADAGHIHPSDTSRLAKASSLSDVADIDTAKFNLKVPVLRDAKAAATANVATLSGTTTIDGVALAAGDRVLLTAQTTGSQNGPWLIQAGAWTRPNDYPSAGVLTSRLVPVSGGTTANQGVWQLKSTTNVTVDTTATTWANVSGTGGGASNYQTLDVAGSAQTQRAALNLIAGAGVAVDGADNAGANRTDVTISAVQPNFWLPSAGTGAKIQTLSRVGGASNQSVLTSGRINYVGLPLPLKAGVTYNGIAFMSGGTALVTGVNQWFALVNVSTLTFLRSTVDDTSTAWAGNTLKRLALSSTYTPVTDTYVYLAIMVNATTVPSLLALSVGSAQLAALTPLIVGQGASAQTVPLADGTVSAALAGSNLAPYAYVD